MQTQAAGPHSEAKLHEGCVYGSTLWQTHSVLQHAMPRTMLSKPGGTHMLAGRGWGSSPARHKKNVDMGLQ